MLTPATADTLYDCSKGCPMLELKILKVYWMIMRSAIANITLVRLMFRFMAYAMMMIGIVFWLSAAGLYYAQATFLNSAKVIQGSIVEIKKIENNAKIRYSPRYAYTTPNGESKSIWSQQKTAIKPVIGATVSLLYNPKARPPIIINNFVEKWLAIVLFGTVGTLVILGCTGCNMYISYLVKNRDRLFPPQAAEKPQPVPESKEQGGFHFEVDGKEEKPV